MNQISADTEHKFYHPDHKFAHIYLDEAKLDYVVTADADEGYAIVFSRNNGQFVCDKDGEIVLETLRGKVRIEMRYKNDT